MRFLNRNLRLTRINLIRLPLDINNLKLYCTNNHLEKSTITANEKLSNFITTLERTKPPLFNDSSIIPDYHSLAFYQFINLSNIDLDLLRKKLLKKLKKMEVLGRFYIGKEGINAQFSVPKNKLVLVQNYFYQPENNNLPFNKGITFNISTSEKVGFEKLHVRIKDQIVATNVKEEEYDISNQPEYLDPEQWHQELKTLLDEGKTPNLFDVRNRYESEIGHFQGANIPDVATFREGMDQLLEDVKGLENQTIYMYCTGGIRCSKAGSILKSKKYSNVKMLKGGITNYGHFIKQKLSDPNLSLFKGTNFTFDKRKGEPINDEIISTCHQCHQPTSRYTNCKNLICNLLFLQCEACKEKFNDLCGLPDCMDPILNREDNIERKPAKHHHTLRVDPKKVLGELFPPNNL